VNTVPDKCPFCGSQIMVHGGNLLRSSDGGFASYECKTVQDIELSDDEWKRAGQSDGCRKREVQLLTKRLDEARERIKRLEEVLSLIQPTCECVHHSKKHRHSHNEPCPVVELICRAREAKP
jgi:hypothetical protein